LAGGLEVEQAAFLQFNANKDFGLLLKKIKKNIQVCLET